MNKDQYEATSLREELEGAWPHPGPKDAWMFLVTEVAEVGDILLRIPLLGGQPNYVRSTEHQTDKYDLELELGDVMLMLCTLANHFGIDLSYALDRTIGKLRAQHGKEGD